MTPQHNIRLCIRDSGEVVCTCKFSEAGTAYEMDYDWGVTHMMGVSFVPRKSVWGVINT